MAGCVNASAQFSRDEVVANNQRSTSINWNVISRIMSECPEVEVSGTETYNTYERRAKESGVTNFTITQAIHHTEDDTRRCIRESMQGLNDRLNDHRGNYCKATHDLHPKRETVWANDDEAVVTNCVFDNTPRDTYKPRKNHGVITSIAQQM